MSHLMRSLTTILFDCVLLQQGQYIFIHDAVLEFIACGDTSIEASNVMKAMTKLKITNQMTRLTG